MCQKQINSLTSIGVSVEIKNNNNHLICQKGNVIVDYYTTRESWFVRGDANKHFGFDELIKYFSVSKPQENAAINSQGLTVRDYFAAKAMQGLVVEAVIDCKKIASMAYRMADAMMKERGKTQ